MPTYLQVGAGAAGAAGAAFSNTGPVPFAVIPIVVIETAQLVLSQFKNFYCSQLIIE